MQGDPRYSQLVSLASRTKMGPGGQDQGIHSKEMNVCPPQGGLYGLLTDTDKQGNYIQMTCLNVYFWMMSALVPIITATFLRCRFT